MIFFVIIDLKLPIYIYFYFILLFNNVIFFYEDLGFILFLCCRCFIDIWFIVDLLRCGIIRHLITMFYLCGDDLDR